MPRKSVPRLSRRAFLAAAAALAVRPTVAVAATESTAVEAVVVGAGAAGIAAARRLAAAGRKFVVIEAADHVGGRCITDTRTFGVPFDRGAHWIHMPDLNPLTKLGPRPGIDVYRAPASQKVRIGLRFAREGELEDFQSAQVRANRAIVDVARRADIPCEQALPNDLGDWRPAIEFVLGPYGCAKDLARVSSVDFAHAAQRDIDAFCRQGFGTLLAGLAQGLPVELSTPATAIDVSRNVAVVTPRGTITARAAIVTVPTNVITAGRIQFTPEIPHRTIDAFGRLPLGSYDHIALELKGNPLGLDSDDLVFEKSADARTAAILANVSGTPLCLIEVAGSFGHDLSAQGQAAMVDFAGDWLARLYGADVKKAIGRAAATRWNDEPLTLGAFSAAVPGGAGARAILTESLNDALWFAGEAAHETLWGTVGGAWESGERAAAAVLARLGPVKLPPAAAETRTEPKRKTKRAHVERRAPHYEATPDFEDTPRIMREE